jgi:hypothetical protein
MRSHRRFPPTLRCLWELFRFDVVNRIRGFEGAVASVQTLIPSTSGPTIPVSELELAMESALTLYPRSVLCLQLSVASSRVMRTYGHSAEVVIGCCHQPLRCHAWVEIGGHMLGSPSAFPKMMSVLYRF